MRTEAIRLYSFDELSKEAKNRAISNARDRELAIQDYWYEYIEEDFCEKLKQYGLDISSKDIRFSGFWNQGDGASFTIDEISGDAFVNLCQQFGVRIPMIKLIARRIFFSITRRDWHYCHPYTVKIHSFVDGFAGERLIKKLDEFENKLGEWKDDLCNELYDSLRAEFYYMLEDKYIEDFLCSGFYEFRENGEMWG